MIAFKNAHYFWDSKKYLIFPEEMSVFKKRMYFHIFTFPVFVLFNNHLKFEKQMYFFVYDVVI